MAYRRRIVPFLVRRVRQHRRTQQRIRLCRIRLNVGLCIGFVVSLPRVRGGRERCLCLGLHFCERRVGHGAC